MPLAVKALFEKFDLKPQGPVKWKTKLPEKGKGIYVISTSSKPEENEGILDTCSIQDKVLEQWMLRSPNLMVQGQKVTKELLLKELNRFWHPKENILYIGQSTSLTNGLAKRVDQFYIHEVGWKGPHTGGYWIKLLAQLEELFVYFSPCENPKDIEFKMLLYFIEHVSNQSLYELNEVGRYLPFANLTADVDKIHTIQHPVHKS